MNNKSKELLFKILTIIAGIIMVAVLIVAAISSKYDQGTSEYNFYMIIGLSLMGIDVIFAIIIIYLVGKVKFTYKGIVSKKLLLKTKTYEEFEKIFLDELYLNQYEHCGEIPTELDCKISYLINRQYSINNIILLVRTNELSENTYNNYFEESLAYINEREEKIFEKYANLIHIVCVDRVNDNLKNVTEQSVEQGYRTFHLPVGISFGSRTVYIAMQKSSLGIFKYKTLVKMFKKYINNQIQEELK